MNNNGDLPYIFVLDLDGTIAGNVSFQAQHASIVNILRKHKIKPHTQYTVPPAFGQHSKLIRPGFTSWIKTMKDMYKEVYFFIYTASEKSWAHQEIAWVEKLHDIKFARPIFTRDDCFIESNSNSIRKSLGKIYPRIISTVIRERGPTRPLSMAHRKTILDNYLVIIDNNAVYNDRQCNLLLCPDYNYTVFENLLTLIPKEARKQPIIQQLIFSLVNTGYMCKIAESNEDGMEALANQYAWLATRCKSLHEQNKVFMNDDFWKYLARIIVKNRIYTFTPHVIKQLQDTCWKHSKNNNSN